MDDERMDGRKDERTDNGTNARTDGPANHGRTDNGTNGRTDTGRTDSQDVLDIHGEKCNGVVSKILDENPACIKF